MFNLSTQDVVLSIENAPLVNLDGIYFQEYENFFGKSFKLEFGDVENFQKLDGQIDYNRSKLSEQDDIVKKLSIFFMNTNVTKALEKKFNTELKFQSLDVWIDDKGYKLDPHVDDSSIKLHLQVYLSDENKGTNLYSADNKKIHTFKFESNRAYALLNNDKSLHGLDEIEKSGRRSIYVRYA